MTARAGLVVRDQYFFGWDKGLQAAGLDPNDITLPFTGDSWSRQRAAPGRAWAPTGDAPTNPPSRIHM
jgi:hypothetical protein